MVLCLVVRKIQLCSILQKCSHVDSLKLGNLASPFSVPARIPKSCKIGQNADLQTISGPFQPLSCLRCYSGMSNGDKREC